MTIIPAETYSRKAPENACEKCGKAKLNRFPLCTACYRKDRPKTRDLLEQMQRDINEIKAMIEGMKRS